MSGLDPQSSPQTPWQPNPSQSRSPFEVTRHSKPLPPERPRRRSRLIPVTIGVVVFVVALIVAVLVARQLQPIIAPLLDREPPLVKRIEQLRSPTISESRRLKAAKALAEMGTDAVVATLDALAVYSPEKDTFSFPKPVPQTLALLGNDLTPALKEAIRSDRENVRIAAFQVLSEMRPGVVEMVEDLGATVNDPNRFVRSFACRALGNLGPEAAPAVPSLMAVIRHTDQFTRLRAVEALAHIGAPAKTALPALKEAAAKEKVRNVHEAIQIAMFEIDTERVAAESAQYTLVEYRELMKAVTKPDERTALAAANALAQRGSTARDAVPSLALALRHSSKAVREAAAKALATMGPHARVAVLSLERAAEDPEEEVREAAKQTLQQIGAW